MNTAVISESGFGGRRIACKGAGLTGKEKRQCARELRKSGWKKGDPIPASMGGISTKDIEAVEKETPEQAAADAPKGSSAGTYIVIGVVLLLIVVAFFLLRKKSAPAA